MTDKLLLEKDGPIGWIVFNQPEKRNAVSQEMWQLMPEYVNDLSKDDAIRVVILRGGGDKSFVSGADISQFEENRATEDARAEYNRTVEAAYVAPILCPKPVVAKIRGICMGGGLGLAAACDLRFAADNAVFRMPAARLGLGYSFTGMKRSSRGYA